MCALQIDFLAVEGNAIAPDIFHTLTGQLGVVFLLCNLLQGFPGLFFQLRFGACGLQFQYDTGSAGVQGEEGQIEAAVAAFTVGLHPAW